MKSFFRFLTEAGASQASMQAQKLNLKSDGHGGWLDSRGEFVAKTEGGKLKFYNQGQKAGEQDPNQVRTPANQQVAATQNKAPAAAPAPAPKAVAPAPEQQAAADGDTLTIVFGRFNPPTIGHEKLLKAANKAATGGNLKIYPSRTQDPKKNPLDPSTKISFMRKMFPDYAEQIINDPDMKSIFDVLVNADKDGYGNVNIVVGSDRQSEFENLAQKYNGDLYQFDLIRVISAGMRDADAEGAEGMSASKMRKAVMDDDLDSFRKGTPKQLDDGDVQTLFNAVRSAMGAKKQKVQKEGYSLWEIAPKYDMKNLRENYLIGKIFKIGDIVENLNTGLIGEVIRRGTNHLICVTEEDYMFKSWIKDVMEAGAYQEKKVEGKMRTPGKPNTLVGTGGYFKYAADMTPGFENGDKTNLQKGAKPYSGYKQSNVKEFINKYKKIKESVY
jgi:hypothetical protein